MKTLWLGAAAAAALLAAAPSLAADAKAASTAAAPTAQDLSKAPRMGTWGFDLAGRDLSTSPGKSFNQFANGSYLKTLTIPSDQASYGAFHALNDLSEARMHAVLEKTAADRAASGDTAKVGALYRSFMDEATVEKLGAQPLAADLAQVRAVKTKADLARLMGQTTQGFGGSLFSLSISEDAKDPERYAVYVGQAGLGLPDRDYYLQASFAEKKTAYQAYVARMLTLAGWPNAEAQAKAIVDMETEIAKVSWTRAERRDDEKMYNATATSELARMAPGFEWAAFLDGAQLGKTDRVVVQESTAFPKIAAIYASAPLETLKARQAFSIVDEAAPYLSKTFADARFEFRGKTLNGQQEQRARWKRGVALVDSNVGEALGKLYVDAYFPADSKAKMVALVGDLRTAMRGRIERVDWMSPQTKAKALEKLAAFRVKIGYPDKWRDYSALNVRDGDLYGNVERAAAFDWAFRAGRLGGPVDKEEWGMTPPTINAYYNPTGNEIVFPAAILQPPFFDPEGDPAVNYGAIGGVIGHELTHGFDDQGRRYDAHGRLTDWWTPEDAAKFQVQATKLGKQYSAYEVLPGAFVNGDLTMGENIADLGGLLLALDAYRASLKGQPAPVIDGLTGEQRVMLGWAQVWRSKRREELQRQLVTVDPHSPDAARVDLPVRNIDAFYQAFGVKPGDAMYVAPADRVRIW
ncbi:M13 family metallopeptidase [Phenylobacterium deserti]|uniref:Peptidase M13 n=1 Tax=Phenylobacterium deserti TaxID=1914756 RepID=A0A328ARR3_9CAUL|nr:M13-type metalloendopeptidase [Phenylobacterium deserti]RAK57732.1 peptidase M13 [Phenylobacterium deserti]